MSRTKIICTLGPSTNTYEKVVELIKAGMNVARLNFSHGTYEEHARVFEILKKVRDELEVPLAIMLDTKGPEVRLGKLPSEGVFLEKGHRWKLVDAAVVGDVEQVQVKPGSILKSLPMGCRVLFDDGYISGTVVDVAADGVVIEVDNRGKIMGGKGVNFPYTSLGLPATTEKDREDIIFGIEQNIDYIAASFIRSAEDVLNIKSLLSDKGASNILVIAKIENHEGIENFDSILQASDGIMIARGDLGVEVPLTQVPRLQKMMIRKCYMAGKPAVTATQMLESMIYNPRPTRAEASDVANAIYDSTSAVMLSGETAAGSYPIEVVETMASIIIETEGDFDYHSFFLHYAPLAFHDVPSSVTLSTVKTAYSSNARAIFVFTSSGTTARLLSRLRPKMPILAMTSSEKTFHQLGLNWGVVPLLGGEHRRIEEAFGEISRFALERGYVKYGDLVVITAGVPFGIAGTTNMMIVESIGDVLVRGKSGAGGKLHGSVMLIHSVEGVRPYEVKDKLIVIAKCDESYLPLMKSSAGVILQNPVDDIESETYAMQIGRDYKKPVIVRADSAFNVLHDSQLVTIEPDSGLVYKGVVL